MRIWSNGSLNIKVESGAVFAGCTVFLSLSQSLSLFLFLNLSPQLAVNAVFAAFAFILQAVLDDTSHVSEQAERGKRRRPVPADTNAVDELCGILIAMLGRQLQIIHCRIGISRNIFTVEINFAELVFGEVIAVLGGYLKTADGFLNILDRILGQIYLACKVRRIGIFLPGGTVKPMDSILCVSEVGSANEIRVVGQPLTYNELYAVSLALTGNNTEMITRDFLLGCVNDSLTYSIEREGNNTGIAAAVIRYLNLEELARLKGISDADIEWIGLVIKDLEDNKNSPPKGEE